MARAKNTSESNETEKESPEAFLTRLSAKATFRAGKELLKNGERVCGSRDPNGGVHAQFRNDKGEITTVYAKVTQTTAQCQCSECGNKPHTLCPHAFAALLYDLKYVPVRHVDIEQTPAEYQGLITLDYRQLATTAAQFDTHSKVRIDVASDFPHVPSQWEKIAFTVAISNGTKIYRGTLSGIRQIHFNKGGILNEKDFSLQTRQIFRYLATNAEDATTHLLLNSEQTAEFFHCLADFPLVYQAGQRIYIHKGEAEPVLQIFPPSGNTQKVQVSIRVNGRIVPFPMTRVITGRNGIWVGFQGEYWWIPAHHDIAWLRSLFKTPKQTLPLHDAQNFIEEIQKAPLEIVTGKRTHSRIAIPQILIDGVLHLEEKRFMLRVRFAYDDLVYDADQARLRDDGEALLFRNNHMESEVIDRLRYFGFSKNERNPSLFSIDISAMIQFVTNDLKEILTDFPTSALSARLLQFMNPPPLQVHFFYKREDQDFLYIETHFTAGDLKKKFYWSDLLPYIQNRVRGFALDESTFIHIPKDVSEFLFQLQTIILPVKWNADTLRVARCNVPYWVHLGKDVLGGVPHAFWGIEYDLKRPFRPEKEVGITAPFEGTLRPYQEHGVYWIAQRFYNHFNVVLADEMGLGKTVQALALLAQTPHPEGVPHLIICPTSLTENWRREVNRFIPQFRAIVAEGSTRSVLWHNLKDYDIVIASYAIIRRDFEFINDQSFCAVVLDEAQHIRNAQTANSRSCKSVKSKYRLVLTGTPLENSPADLWSIFDFLNPNMLGTQSAFMRRFAALNNTSLQNLTAHISPLMLRRKKNEVCTELPAKTEQLIYCEMNSAQRLLYQQYFEAGQRQCANFTDPKSGVKVTRFDILVTLMRLRQICCHPQLLPDVAPNENWESSKVELLMEMLSEALDSNHKVLIFSQFTSMLAILKKELDKINVPYEYLDGNTKNRQEHVDRFNNQADIPIFLLSLKAGGVGLNLTAADTVIIFDPWWNPATENQASDRAHRIGQTRPVTLTRIIVKDSIEERILQLKAQKQKIFDELIESHTDVPSAAELSASDIEFLLSPLETTGKEVVENS